MLRPFSFSFLLFIAAFSQSQIQPTEEALQSDLRHQQYDLSTDGKAFLLQEASGASFFLLGELHGENEIPHLLRDLWPEMSKEGYLYVAGELSPWQADELEFAPAQNQPKLLSLWTKEEAGFVHSFGRSRPALWGCDIEEGQPQLLIRDLETLNPNNPVLAQMAEITRAGYERKTAPQLLHLALELRGVRDRTVNGTSLLQGIVSTLMVEADRSDPSAKLKASIERESVMKDLFLRHYEQVSSAEASAKIMLRFGRNHLHRGYDERGVSTLGNFVAEFAVAHHKSVFNVAAFGAGGKASLHGETWDADERSDDLAFAFLSSVAQFPGTVFDLRPLRPALHKIPQDRRTPVEQRLVYWADSYDAIIYYKTVTPLIP